ncbi:hypothetical protein [Thiomicrorhabdus lithotrophica]|uniref:Carbohydrate porin n=1 Tax=Thiomicrorhabdus lithotrophica TaxID=2949997 RepID=A0ABY8C6T3_9GAMM|nr:hypothetical protein [Thiomicrorhabdus lithotrophica]WEJ61609.1 carbohydrate porin [Thiomicrorhabdus lithotrophica]
MANTSIPLNTELGINLIHQHTSDSQITPETTFSVDLSIEYAFSETDLIGLHIEGSSTPQKEGLSSTILDSNADSSSAIDHADNGRIQVSQLFYQSTHQNNKRFTIGLLDVTSFLDSSLIVNDENQQFITPSLVNNPVIDFPDYVIGLAYESNLVKNITSTVFISSTHGIADNQSRNYANLFEVQKDEKGLFSAAEIQYINQDWLINGGIWLHNGNHEALDDNTKIDLSNYGIYSNINRIVGNHTLGFRAGLANPKVSIASEFISLAYQYSTKQTIFGLGYSKIITSGFNEDETLKNNQEMIELYSKYELNENLSLTPTIQLYKNPQIDTTLVKKVPNNLFNLSLRLNYQF